MSDSRTNDGDWPSGASVIIVSLSERDDVFRACESSLAQSHQLCEVIVYMNQHDEARASHIRQRFPTVRLILVDPQQSYIAYRNRGFHDACGAFVFWLDDDAYFSSADTISQAVTLFEADPSIASLSLRYVEPDDTVKTIPNCPLSSSDPVAGFVGCAVGFRRDLVVQMQGLRELYFAYGEERDLALRMFDLGHRICFADTPPIVHMVSRKRNKFVQNSYAVRNTILFDYLNVPFPDVLPKTASDAVKLLLYKLTWRTAWDRVRYVSWGFGSCLTHWRLRSPVSRSAYRTSRSLPRTGAELWPPEAIPASVSR